MKKWVIKNGLYLAGAVVGAVAGYAYYFYIGCASGTCAITSKPLNSTLYFAAMGAVFFGMFQPQKKQQELPSTSAKINKHEP
jgi:hypothetical protein